MLLGHLFYATLGFIVIHSELALAAIGALILTRPDSSIISGLAVSAASAWSLVSWINGLISGHPSGAVEFMDWPLWFEKYPD